MGNSFEKMKADLKITCQKAYNIVNKPRNQETKKLKMDVINDGNEANKCFISKAGYDPSKVFWDIEYRE